MIDVGTLTTPLQLGLLNEQVICKNLTYDSILAYSISTQAKFKLDSTRSSLFLLNLKYKSQIINAIKLF